MPSNKFEVLRDRVIQRGKESGKEVVKDRREILKEEKAKKTKVEKKEKKMKKKKIEIKEKTKEVVKIEGKEEIAKEEREVEM